MSNDAASFSVAVNRWLDGAKITADEVVRRIALRVWEELVGRTPIDTGRAQSGWVTNLDEPSDYVPPEIPADVQAAREAARRSGAASGRIVPEPEPPDLSAATIANRIFIVNNTPYIVQLDQGSSQKSPAGMVAVTMAQVQEELETLVGQDAG